MMSVQGLYVITIASEKGGVGKTSLATNLAVYLKALHEDLPVSIASFDNHFSVDQMFAIGRQRGRSVNGLFGSEPLPELMELGEYGVQYLASEQRMERPEQEPASLRQRLITSGLSGVLILDTKPILDFFTEAALLAADLVFTPVKDRASLVNASALRRVLEGQSAADRLWLVPSLIDGRLRLPNGVGMAEFLRFSGEERGFQVSHVFVNKSPKVEGLMSGFSSRIYPVLTHARGTSVHRQYRRLAEFALRLKKEHQTSATPVGVVTGDGKRLLECPGCGQIHDGREGHFYSDLRGRRRGYIHSDCLAGYLNKFSLQVPADGALVFELQGAGWNGPEPELTLRVREGEGYSVDSETILPSTIRRWEPLLAGLTGRSAEEWGREAVLVTFQEGAPSYWLSDAGQVAFTTLRGRILRQGRQLD